MNVYKPFQHQFVPQASYLPTFLHHYAALSMPLPHITAKFPAGIIHLSTASGKASASLLSQRCSWHLENPAFPMTQEAPPVEVVLGVMQVTDIKQGFASSIAHLYHNQAPGNPPVPWDSGSWWNIQEKKEKPITCEVEVGKNQLHCKRT